MVTAGGARGRGLECAFGMVRRGLWYEGCKVCLLVWLSCMCCKGSRLQSRECRLDGRLCGGHGEG